MIRAREMIRTRHDKTTGHFASLVYLLFPTVRETLQGGFLEVFNLFSGQFSIYFLDKIREKIVENPYFPY